jgi:hypothetical protein
MTTRMLVDPKSFGERCLSIARKNLGNGIVQDVLIEDDIDLDGAICLRITFVLKSNSVLRAKGEKLGEISLAIRNFLNEQNDPRFPYVHYATKTELNEIAAHND